MTKLAGEISKISQVKSYIAQKTYENSVTDDYLDGKVSEDLMAEVMSESDFMFDSLISMGHVKADLIRAAGI